MESEDHPTLQDRVFYPGRAWQYSHPDRLATNAWLFGMEPASVTECRVLELGCGAGQNLIPMAYVLPNAQFLGIELAARPVEYGRQIIADLGLANVELRQLDICSAGQGLGEFDFIIAHGVYTWVSREVREEVLRICSAHLAPHGVAYLNYNALPGGYIRGIVRDMMRVGLQKFADPAKHIPEAVRQVRSLIELQPETSPYGALLREELDRVEHRPPDVLYHDDLAPENASVYLHEVLDAAAGHGLQYLCESRLADVHVGKYPAAVQNVLHQLGGDRVNREQYLDFLVCRKYRRTLLCRAGLPVAPTFSAERMRALRVASNTRPVSAPVDPADGVVVRFRDPENTTMEIADAVVKSTLVLLNEIWPKTVEFGDLLRDARRRMERTGGRISIDEQDFAITLASAYAAGFVDLHTWEPEFARTPGDRPRASALARYERDSQDCVTGLRHNTIYMDDPLSSRILRLLDGSRDRSALMNEINGLTPDGLEGILDRFAGFCLLEA